MDQLFEYYDTDSLDIIDDYEKSINLGNVFECRARGHQHDIKSCSFSPDGLLVVSYTKCEEIGIWDVETGKCLAVFDNTSRYVHSVMFLTSRVLTFVSHQDNVIRLWDVDLMKYVDIVQSNRDIVPYYNCYETIANSENTTILEGHRNRVRWCSFFTDNSKLISCSDDGTTRLWDIKTRRCLKVIRNCSLAVSCQFSRDGSVFAKCYDSKKVSLSSYDSDRYHILLKGHKDVVSSCTFSSDGLMVVTSSTDKTVRLWDVKTGECLKILEGHTASVKSSMFSPNGSMIVSCSSDKTVRLWDVETGECLKVLEDHTDQVNSCSFSPDGLMVVSCSNDKTVRLWDVGYILSHD